MIYTPSYFDATGHDALVTDLVLGNNFGMLLMQSESEPLISHLPFLYRPRSGEHPPLLLAHVARLNPQAHLISEGARATAIFQGPHAYISPRWYQPAPDHVPTWNYAVVHMHGKIQAIEGEAAYQAMKDLVHTQDPDWQLVLSERDKRALMQGILVFTIELQKIEAKFKLSQNRTADDQASVMAQLEKGSPDEQSVASLMRQVCRP